MEPILALQSGNKIFPLSMSSVYKLIQPTNVLIALHILQDDFTIGLEEAEYVWHIDGKIIS
tara:strand:- start:91316 stop:91498 length:183 start_codon:yes stop_codon:yes gene_type:complete